MKSKNGIHGERLKAIRPYVSFNYNLNQPLAPAQKAKITRYYNELKRLQARDFQVKRFRNPSRLKAAQEYSQHDSRLSEIKVAVMPVSAKSTLDVKFTRSGEIRVTVDSIETTNIYFDPMELEANAEEYVQNLVDTQTNANHFNLMTGNSQTEKIYARDRMGRAVDDIINNPKYGEDGQHYWADWLLGARGLIGTDHATALEYNKERVNANNAHKAKMKDVNKAEKNRLVETYGKTAVGKFKRKKKAKGSK